MNDTVLLMLTVHPSLEETLVDWLLEHAPGVGFSVSASAGHPHAASRLSLAEQVRGRRDQVRFDVHLPQSGLETLLEGLRRDFPGSGAQYWVVPVVGNATL